MYLLGIQERFSDEVTVSSLPHPISMFILGFTIFTVLLLYIEYRRNSSDFKELKKEFEDLKDKVDTYELNLNSRLTEISKKVDSRVDKAILSIKKHNKGE